MNDIFKSDSMRQKVYNQIFDKIISGCYLPDEILKENNFIQEFKMSKSPVREAMIELCRDNILYSIPRHGYRIYTFNEDEINKIIQFRVLVEPHYLNKYWDSIDGDKIRIFYDDLLHTEEIKKPFPIVNHWKNNILFHTRLASLFHDDFYSRTLIHTLRCQTMGYVQFYYRRYKSTKIVLDQSSHLKIIEAIIAKDRSAAIRHLKEDILEYPEAKLGIEVDI